MVTPENRKLERQAMTAKPAQARRRTAARPPTWQATVEARVAQAARRAKGGHAAAGRAGAVAALRAMEREVAMPVGKYPDSWEHDRAYGWVLRLLATVRQALQRGGR